MDRVPPFITKLRKVHSVYLLLALLLVADSKTLSAQTLKNVPVDSLKEIRLAEERRIDSIAERGWICGGLIDGYGSPFRDDGIRENHFALFLTQNWKRFGFGFRSRMINSFRDTFVPIHDGTNPDPHRQEEHLNEMHIQFGPSIVYRRATFSSNLAGTSSFSLTPSFSYYRSSTTEWNHDSLKYASSTSLFGASIMADLDILLLFSQTTGFGVNINGSITTFNKFDYGIGFVVTFGQFPWVREE